ncbi:hypothetical protein [Krasilnikovia sp. M28-CT-15]|uniref:hypothetical protein n=1 Tax=Krasilnikovia sp. M28-CT-15 TaxID=3373540 RepID=UPI003875CC07
MRRPRSGDPSADPPADELTFQDRRTADGARQSPATGGRYQVDASGARGVQVGDHGHQQNTLVTPEKVAVVQVGDHTRAWITMMLPRSVRIAVISLIAVTLVSGGVWAVVAWWLPEHAPTSKTEFLIDTAGATGTPAGLTPVTDSLRTTVRNSGDSDALALRSFGGDCDAKTNTTRLVDFDTDNRGALTEAAPEATAGGHATLLRGIVEAVNDFSRPFETRAKHLSRIIVVTRHGADGCDADPAFVEQEIRDRLDAAGLTIEFRLIGYQVAKNERDQLARIATASRAPRPAFVSTPAELAAALDWYTNTEPVLDDAKGIIDVLNPTITQVNNAVRATTGGRTDAADQALDTARSAISSADTRFEDLRSRGSTPTARDIHQRALALRAQQGRVVDAAEALLETARSGGSLDRGLATFGQVAADYNAEVNAMNDVLDKLRATAPGRKR